MKYRTGIHTPRIETHGVRVRLFVMALVIFHALPLSAQSTDYKPGDTLYAWAVNGMMLRAEPSLDGKVIMKLTFGQHVVVKEIEERDVSYEILPSVNHKNLTFPAITVTGNFIKIINSGKEGYVFGGLLSRLKPMNDDEKVEAYFSRIFGILKVLADVKSDSSDARFKRILYANGTTLQHENGNENWWSHLYLIPDITVREAYLFINRLVDFETQYKRSLDDKLEWIEAHPLTFEPHHIVLQSGPFEQTDIAVLRGYAIISKGGGN